MPKVLVVGGTGMLGRPIVVRLFQEAFDIRVFTTNPDRARRYFGDKVEYAKGDVGVRESLRQAMEGCDYVYVNLKGGPTKDDYVRIEEEGSKNIYAAAKEMKIKKLIQISEARADEKHTFFIAHKVKVAAEKALKASGLTYTVLKPTWFCESLPLTLQGNTATLVGPGKASFHFVAVADYARIVSECFKTDKADNKSLVIFGPEKLTLEEALARFLKIVYPDYQIKRLPIWLARLAAAFSFNKRLRALVNLMVFFNKNDDSEVSGDPKEIERLFESCTITVDEYAGMYRKIVKG